MANFWQYCERLSTSQLQALLQEECAGRGKLTPDDILQICQILSTRNKQWPSYREAILELCKNYLK